MQSNVGRSGASSSLDCSQASLFGQIAPLWASGSVESNPMSLSGYRSTT